MFKSIIYTSLFLSILLVISSCGKENTVSPILTSEKIISIYENQTNVLTLVATSRNVITYSLSGGDSKDFNVNKKSGVVTFKVAPNYEEKKLYSFIAKVTDNKGNENSQNITINILDINENKIPIKNINRKALFVSQIAYEGDTIKDNSRYSNTPYYGDPTTRPPKVNTPTAPKVNTPTAPKVDTPKVDNTPINEEEEEIIQEVYKNYTRDNFTNIVIDDTTRIMWQDNLNVKTSKLDWEEAKMYCDNMILGGYEDWVLPTLSELNGIIDNKKSNTSVSNAFKNFISRNYWSSTKYVSDDSNAWVINLYHGNTYGSYKTSKYHVTCVRNRL